MWTRAVVFAIAVVQDCKLIRSTRHPQQAHTLQLSLSLLCSSRQLTAKVLQVLAAEGVKHDEAL